MSRLLRINGFDIDIDDETAIGITLQSYDIKEPSQRKVNITNSFTIPLTTNNNKIFSVLRLHVSGRRNKILRRRKRLLRY